MQNELLDILILGLFVVLFASIYFKRAGGRLRFWVAGWLLVVLHFAVQLIQPVSGFSYSLTAGLSVGALVLSGICFLLSSSSIAEDLWLCTLVAVSIGMPALFYECYVLFGGHAHLPLYAAASVGGIGGTALAIILHRRRMRHLIFIVLTFAAGEFWTFYAVAHHRPQDGISAFLAEIFLTFASLYWFDFRRLSAGVLTSLLGLFAWAAFFPLSLVCESWMPGVPISAGLWNVPKYFVAFGMILTLLEDEICAAGKASGHYRLLFTDNPHPMWIHDPETLRFLRVNDAAIEHYGYSRDEFMSMTLHDLRPSEDIEALLGETAKSDSFTLSGPWQHCKKDGSEIQVDVAAHVIDFEGRSCRFVLVQDVTERQRLHSQLVHQAHHDILTGLPNRLLLEDRMRQVFAHATRHGQRAAVICIDLDRFKQINDTFGHAVGDQCLQSIAAQISTRLRAVDTVARTGGEEFLVVLSELGGMRDAEVVAQDLLECIRQPIETGGQMIQLSASLGIAVYPDDATDSTALWRAADSAMYRAKRCGGNQSLFASPEISSAANEASEVEQYMRRMLKEGGFELHYQPVYSMGGALCSLEALLRLQHPRLGMIPPDRFIPIAEECGLIVPIGNWVLEEVCRQSVEWQRQGLKPIRIAFNVSPLQFMRSDFSTEVMRALSHYELDPLLLELEVTETTVMCNLPEVARQMRGLASLGVHLSVDDFGTGYSSLSHLHQLPISTLKIDRSFVERVSAVNGTYSIVQAIVALGHSLGLQVVAEGVERGDQLEGLRQIGCDFLQGYLFAAPLPAARVSRHLAPSALHAVHSASQGKRTLPSTLRARTIPS
ncbi:MAG TPA: EAL domain-containing protein [Acidobacteriaceae bacterium]|nr:EAL domain-containing protein [Acidobacteriaceae bacterium]